jgi:hypothetical protein
MATTLLRTLLDLFVLKLYMCFLRGARILLLLLLLTGQYTFKGSGKREGRLGRLTSFSVLISIRREWGLLLLELNVLVLVLLEGSCSVG